MRLTLIAVSALILGIATEVSAQRPEEETKTGLEQLFNLKSRLGKMPDLPKTNTWFNSLPISTEDLRGHVTLIDFWAYDCVGCQQALPHVKAWYAKYHDQGLIVLAVHPLVGNFTDDIAHIKRAIKDSGITHPIAFDSAGKFQAAFENMAFPALYFIDKKGNVRKVLYGPGEVEESERMIQKLLAE